MTTEASIFVTVVSILFFIGLMLPYINAEFGGYSTGDTDGLDTTTRDGLENMNPVSIFDIILSIAGMFTWTFGLIPFWLDGFFLFIRLIGLYLFIRLIRGGG